MKKKVYQLSANRAIGVKNAATPEGQQFADEVIAAINEAFEALNEDEEEHTPEEFAESVRKAVEDVLANLAQAPAPVQEYIQNAIKAQMKNITNVTGAKGVSKEVKKEVCEAIMGFTGKSGELLKEQVNAICKKNGISGLTFADLIDYEIVDKFGQEDRLYAMLHQTKISRFFYSTADMQTAAAIAKQWDKTSARNVEKDIQQIEATPKTITTDYVYKRQEIAQADLDEIARAGEESSFVAYITEELRRVVVNTCIMAILVGDAVNDEGKKVVVFESIATKSATDAFTIVSTAAAAVPTVAEVRAQADLIHNPKALKKVAIMSAATKTALAGYRYAAGGDLYFRSDAELAGQLGVDEIYTTDLMAGNGVIVMLPEEYWVLEKNTIEVAYPKWERNAQNWQYEKNIGGKIHGLLSSAYIKPAEDR